MSGNQALITNSLVGVLPDLAITDHGSDWYWTVCALMAVSTLTLMGLSYTKRKTHRLFHYNTAAITFVAFVSYYSMASGLGQTAVQVEFIRPDSQEVYAAGTRQIFWVRYVDYAITTPLILTNLLLTAYIPRPTMLATLLVDEVMVVCYLAGALTPTSYKWGYFAMALFAYFFVVYSLLLDGRRYASALGGAINKTFLSCTGLTVLVWSLYPIAWGVSEGGNLIHPDSEAVFYGILDIFAKIVVGFMLVLGHKRIDPSELGLNIREHSTLPRDEKHGGHDNHRNRFSSNGRRKGLMGRRNGSRDHHDNYNRYDHHDGIRDHRDNYDRYDHRNEVTDHRNPITGHKKDVTDHHDRATEHHNSVTNFNDRAAIDHHNDRATNDHHNVGLGRNKEGADYYDRSDDRHHMGIGRNKEGTGYYGRSDDHRDGMSNYHDGNRHRRGGKSSGGGILGLFRKKNHYDDANHEYRERDRSPGRGGFFERDRSPARDEYRTDRRSRFGRDHHGREHSPLRGDYRAGQRSPGRDGYRNDNNPLTTDGGYNRDGNRSFHDGEYHGDARRSFPGGEGHRDGRRSFPGGEYQGDGRQSALRGDYDEDGCRSYPRADGRGDHNHRPFMGGDHRSDKRRSGPIGDSNEDDRRYFPGSENRIGEPRATSGIDNQRQNIRSVPAGEFAENRRPVPGGEPHRQSGSPALGGGGGAGYGANRQPILGDAARPDNRRPSGEYRQDNAQHTAGFGPQTLQSSNGYQGDKRYRSGDLHETLGTNVGSSNPVSSLEAEQART